jgi:hypothetical protein
MQIILFLGSSGTTRPDILFDATDDRIRNAGIKLLVAENLPGQQATLIRSKAGSRLVILLVSYSTVK